MLGSLSRFAWCACPGRRIFARGAWCFVFGGMFWFVVYLSIVVVFCVVPHASGVPYRVMYVLFFVHVLSCVVFCVCKFGA